MNWFDYLNLIEIIKLEGKRNELKWVRKIEKLIELEVEIRLKTVRRSKVVD